jgi:AcrR family transcriptional regulator
MGRREDNRERTRRALADAAVEQFLSLDYAKVTMDSIADAAGVSRRTAYRHGGGKEEFILHHPDRWREVFRAHMAAGQAHALTLLERLHQASLAVVAHIEHDPQPVRQAFAAVNRHPQLAVTMMADTGRWMALLTEEIERAVCADTPLDLEQQVTAGILAAALMGMIDRVYRAWVENGTDMGPLIDLGFELLEPTFTQAMGAMAGTGASGLGPAEADAP